VALRSILGTGVNLANSAITLLSYVFIPQFLGLEQIEIFLRDNIYPGILVLVFSVGIPNYVKRSEELGLLLFLLILVSIIYFFSWNFLWYSNLLWLSIGVVSQKELIKGRFYLFSALILGLSLTNLTLILLTQDWRMAHLVSPLLVLVFYSFAVKSVNFSIKRIREILSSRFRVYSTLNKVLGISLLWWIISFRYKLEGESLYNLSVYQKVTLSMPVAVLGFISLINYLKNSLSWGWRKDMVSLVISIVIGIGLGWFFDDISWALTILLIFTHVPVVYLQNKLFEERYYTVLYIPFALSLFLIGIEYILYSLVGFLTIIRLCLYVQNWSSSSSLQRTR
jgi:hypothetical protein